MSEETSAQERLIANAIEEMDSKEKWVGAYRASAWSAIALAVIQSNQQAYTENLAEAAARFVQDKSPENYEALVLAVSLYRNAT